MRTSLKATATAAAASLALLAPTIAFADTVTATDTDLITTPDGVKHLTIVLGATAQVTLVYASTDEDGKPGCNLNGQGSHLLLNIAESSPQVAGVAATLDFASCANSQIAVSGDAVGSSTISFSVGSFVTNKAGVTASDFNVGAATFQVDVVPVVSVSDADGDGVADASDNCVNVSNADQADFDDDGKGDVCDDMVPPVVAVTVPAANGTNGWFKSSPVIVTVSASDNVGVTSFTCTRDGTPVTVTNPGTVQVSADGAHSVACSAQDAEGNTGTGSGSLKIDATAPAVTLTPAANDGANGWFVTDPAKVGVAVVDANLASVACTDSVDGGVPAAIAVVSGALSVSGNGVHALSCTATDAAGNTGSDAGQVKMDTEIPGITHTLSPDGGPNAFGWYNTQVTVDFSCTDFVSLIGTCAGDTTLGQGENQSATGTATDNAGNTAADSVTDLDIDLTDPVLNVDGAASGAWDICAGGAPARPSFSPSDALSGLQSSSDSWTTPSAPSGVGTYVYNAQALDKADNPASETRTYSLSYGSAFSGVLQPINADGTSRFKLGSTVPVKFRLTCNGTPISTAVASLRVTIGDTAPDPGVDEVASTSAATTGNLFRYDATAGQYIFNLATKPGFKNPNGTAVTFIAGTWTLAINLDDGTVRNVKIQLVK